ncbi:MAG: serine/threonine protein kinase [Trueperaceae bacterium]|nr:serine/threonine protein kinase [Trueperaceae bacterium]
MNRLGSGQTAHVYAARHAVFGDVALKLPRPELAHRPVLRRMFENEVAITTKLASPQVVSAYEGFPTGPGAFLALEYCRGGTLDQLLLEKGLMPLDRCYRFILDVAAGLAHSHERQVLHRDVKPANVFLTSEGAAKLGDFGTGMFMSDDTSDRVGTAFYMAPEVFEGKPAGIRSDIYSLGVLAYEVIGGERPFTGNSYDALMVAHRTGVPKDLRGLRQGLSPEVVRVVALAMMRDPAKRFASAVEFGEALGSVTGTALRRESASRSGTAEPAQTRVTGRGSRAVGRGGGEDDGGGRPDEGRRRDHGKGAEGERARRPKGGVFGWLKRGRG